MELTQLNRHKIAYFNSAVNQCLSYIRNIDANLLLIDTVNLCFLSAALPCFLLRHCVLYLIMSYKMLTMNDDYKQVLK